ncbi:MAG: STAS domain-containing protein [Spirochaetes bacterium]|jgi:anti-anti-sigma factor|nr:STAS domain-containing protein [Spirochaetota bacterium]
MKFNTVDSDNERTFIPEEDLVAPRINKFEESIFKFILFDKRDVIIDMKNVGKIDSMSIAALIRLKKKITEENRNFYMINPNESVYRVLELSGLDNFLLD